MDSLGLPSEPALYTSDIQIIVIIMSKAAGESSMYSQFQKPPTRKKAGGGGRGGGGEGGGVLLVTWAPDGECVLQDLQDSASMSCQATERQGPVSDCIVTFHSLSARSPT